MSHKVVQKVAFLDSELLQKACAALGIQYEAHGTARFYTRSETATGQLVHLKGWKYPVVISEDGLEVAFDSWDGSGYLDETRLNELKAEYSKQVVLYQAHIQGWNVEDVTTNDKGELVVRIGRG